VRRSTASRSAGDRAAKASRTRSNHASTVVARVETGQSLPTMQRWGPKRLAEVVEHERDVRAAGNQCAHRAQLLMTDAEVERQPVVGQHAHSLYERGVVNGRWQPVLQSLRTPTTPGCPATAAIGAPARAPR
jgi:hypothetical protein